eukprot:11368189-Ditylum_brightwellii.AAC.1
MRHGPRIKFGVRIPKDHHEDLEFEKNLDHIMIISWPGLALPLPAWVLSKCNVTSMTATMHCPGGRDGSACMGVGVRPAM